MFVKNSLIVAICIEEFIFQYQKCVERGRQHGEYKKHRSTSIRTYFKATSAGDYIPTYEYFKK
jgi:hypothetical protein